MPETLTHDDLVARIRTRFAERTRGLVGIVGPPGSGKSTFTRSLSDTLDGCPVVPMDGYHLPNDVLDRRGLRGVKGSPPTFDAIGFVESVRRVALGHDDVVMADFDRTLDEPRADRVVIPAAARIVIVEGNYLLLRDEPWVGLRSAIDVFVYLDVDDEVRRRRLIARHIEFGKSPDEAERFVMESDERNTVLIAASRGDADFVVRLD